MFTSFTSITLVILQSLNKKKKKKKMEEGDGRKFGESYDNKQYFKALLFKL